MVLHPVEFLMSHSSTMWALQRQSSVCIASTTQGHGNALPNFDSKFSVHLADFTAHLCKLTIQDKFADPMQKEWKEFHMLWSLQHTSGTYHLLCITEVHEDRNLKRLTAGCIKALQTKFTTHTSHLLGMKGTKYHSSSSGKIFTTLANALFFYKHTQRHYVCELVCWLHEPLQTTENSFGISLPWFVWLF